MIFNDRQKEKADFILASPHARLSDLLKHEIKDLAVVWSYYSGKIEGNTYSYVETECLLKDGITSEKRYEDAKMLKNLYNGFITVLERILKIGGIDIDRRTVLTVHSMLIDELVQDVDKGILRTKPVRITGTTYVPPEDTGEITIRFENLLSEQNRYANPLERAVYLHCNMARLQPFIDGNKRTSRLLESIVLMNHDIIPVYSSRDEDLIEYRDGLIRFYEKEDYTPYADYFLNRQIRRINGLSRGTDIKFELDPERKTDPPKPALSHKMRV